MAGIKQTSANALLDSLLSGTHYIGLYTTAPTGTTAGVEVSGGSYARQAITFASATSGSKASNVAATFPAASAAWGTVTAWCVSDAASAGNQKTFRTLASSITVNSGDQVIIPSGNVIHTLS